MQRQHLSFRFFRFLCLGASGSAEGGWSGSGLTLGWGASEALLLLLLLLLLAGGSSILGHSAAVGRAALGSISAAKPGAHASHFCNLIAHPINMGHLCADQNGKAIREASAGIRC